MMRLHLPKMLQRFSRAAADKRGVEDARRLYEADVARAQAKLDNAYQAGYAACEARIPALLNFAREDAEKHGYQRGAHEHGNVLLEVCAEHGTKLVRLRDGLHLTFGLCHHLHEAARLEPCRDTDGIVPATQARAPRQTVRLAPYTGYGRAIEKGQP